MHTHSSPHLIRVHYPAEYSLAALDPVFITVAVIETFQQLPTTLLTKKSTKPPQCTFLEKTQDYILSSKMPCRQVSNTEHLSENMLFDLM